MRTIPLAILAAVVLAGSAPAADEKKPASEAPIYDTTMDGRKQLEHGMQYAARTSRLLFVNFGTNDCAPCRTANRAIHEQKFFDVFADTFYPVFIDVTPGSKNAALLEKFQIDKTKGFPAVMLFDETLKLVEVTKKGEFAEVAKKGETDVQGWILDRLPRPSPR